MNKQLYFSKIPSAAKLLESSLQVQVLPLDAFPLGPLVMTITKQLRFNFLKKPHLLVSD